MQNIDGVNIKGELHLRVVDHEGNVLQQFAFNNLVVNNGKLNVAKLLGGDAAGKKIDTVGVGTSATAAAVTDTTLTGSFTRAVNGNTAYSAITYPANGQVQFAFTIQTSEANGMTINEFGLLNTNGDLCARKVLSTSISKTSAFAIEGEWIIKVL